MNLDDYISGANFQWRESESPGISRCVLSSVPRRTWVERREIWTMPSDPSSRPIDMTNGYALDGSYIGDADEARYLDARGIVAQRRSADATVAAVGFCPGAERWFGWSHRALADFATREEADRFAESVASEELAKKSTYEVDFSFDGSLPTRVYQDYSLSDLIRIAEATQGRALRGLRLRDGTCVWASAYSTSHGSMRSEFDTAHNLGLTLEKRASDYVLRLSNPVTGRSGLIRDHAEITRLLRGAKVKWQRTADGKSSEYVVEAASGRSPRPGSAAERMQSLASLPALAAGQYGEGWWYSDVTRRLTRISGLSDVGGSGDHDGWMTLDENAREVGVDPKLARAFVAMYYGIDDAAFAAMLPEGMTEKSFAYPGRQCEGDANYAKAFEEHFGVTVNTALDAKFPKLLRVRLWGNGLLAVTGDGVKMADVWRRCRDAVAKELKDGLRGVTRVELDDPARDFYATLTRDQWLLNRDGLPARGES